MKLLGISGSLRRASLNTVLLRAAVGLVPDGVTLETGTITGIPLYDGDVEEAGGLPEAVVTLKAQIAAADGVVLVTPEYNGSMPGVFKNAVDWLSRPPGQPGVFKDKPVAIMGASPGGFGTVLSQDAWLGVLRSLGTRHWFGGRVLLSRAHQAFDARGQLTDKAAEEQVRQMLAGFARFVG
ncbi:NAD(P)H-dependent oxidoreductase [Oleomonas cavernae]|uniref:NAD(P)H-dependent oxidoreductase n=1 Tax=Oleomonas cavernae TaxID=2320859 RepID=A0A418WAI6_9PROT|nr:NADPH-dependent FMN reductase [Oleomonas cavernae]RJF87053.1 NAD(P)H-dependent oxidoreductase [Oleomonas cavernae]